MPSVQEGRPIAACRFRHLCCSAREGEGATDERPVAGYALWERSLQLPDLFVHLPVQVGLINETICNAYGHRAEQRSNLVR